MSLGNSNISLSAIKAETGLSSNKGTELVGSSILNPYSYYAPGQLNVDSNKNIIIVPPASNFKACDFRSYNHSAIKPSILTPSQDLAWGPGGAFCSFVMNYRLEALNLYAFADRGDYITMDFYSSPTNRIDRANIRQRFIFAIPVVADIPLIGHTRQSAYKQNTSGWIQCTINGFDTAWLSSSTTAYVDTYISDLTNARRINFGTSVADGYSSIVLVENEYPYLYGSNTNVPTPPSGYTAIFPAISGSTPPVCSYGSQVDMSLGTAYAFNVVAKGIYGAGARVVRLDSVDIILTLDGVRTICATGVTLSHGGGFYCSGTLAGGGTWNYNDEGAVTFENATIQSTPSFTQC